MDQDKILELLKKANIETPEKPIKEKVEEVKVVELKREDDRIVFVEIADTVAEIKKAEAKELGFFAKLLKKFRK